VRRSAFPRSVMTCIRGARNKRTLVPPRSEQLITAERFLKTRKRCCSWFIEGKEMRILPTHGKLKYTTGVEDVLHQNMPRRALKLVVYDLVTISGLCPLPSGKSRALRYICPVTVQGARFYSGYSTRPSTSASITFLEGTSFQASLRRQLVRILEQHKPHVATIKIQDIPPS